MKRYAVVYPGVYAGLFLLSDKIVVIHIWVENWPRVILSVKPLLC